jgi:glucan phosphoethanolaminetransferase (alkaline phosphatase superfamily)
MRWLLFLSRQSFIFGVFFILAILVRMNIILKEDSLVSDIVSIGYFIGVLIVPITILLYLLVFLIKRKLRPYVPVWLIISNILFLFVLLYYIFFLDDPYYHKK